MSFNDKSTALLRKIESAESAGIRSIELEEFFDCSDKGIRCRVRDLLAAGVVQKFVGLGTGGPAIYVGSEFAKQFKVELEIKRHELESKSAKNRAKARQAKRIEAKRPRDRNTNLKPERLVVEAFFATFSPSEVKTIEEIAEAVNMPAKEARLVLRRMVSDGWASCAEFDGVLMWGQKGSTNRGRADELSRSRICNGTSRGPYIPSELRTFEGRAGAMDAYKLPSRGICA